MTQNRSVVHSSTDALDDPAVGLESFDTSELRWFANGMLPSPYVEWFTRSGRVGAVEIRSDEYIRGSGADLGIKRRGGGPVEVKTRREVRELLTVDGGLTGRVEEWRKQRPSVDLSGDETWIAVDKVVITRRFALAADGRLVAGCEIDAAGAGCDVELASVTVNGDVGWTYAFEAYGPAELRLAVMRRSAAAVTAGVPHPPGFAERLTRSLGYPEWLSDLAR